MHFHLSRKSSIPRTDKINITLDDNKEVFNPGDTVKGVATIIIDEDVEAKSIDLLIKGTAVCQLLLTEFYNWNGLDVYINMKIRLWDGNKHGHNLAQGTYNYPFSFKIPRSSISSYDGPLCTVSYYIKVVIDRDGLFHWDNKKKLVLKVVSALDLNELENNVAKPVTKFIAQTLTTGDNYGMLDASIKLPKIGYTSGETLIAKINMKNTLGKEISEVQLVLVEVVTLTAGSNGTYYCKESIGTKPNKIETTRNEKNVANVKKSFKIAPYESLSKEISLKIPDNLVPTSTSSPIMHIEYKLVVKITIGALISKDSVVQNEIPITIGTFPVLSKISLKGLPPINGNPNIGLARSVDGLNSPSVDGLHKFTLEIDDKRIPRSASANMLEKYNI
uniref:Arrestin C-terminal-like domain-containing protein n=1 Tax=Acrobeloides nanus TaxID=290746 RepID=A0A914DKI7_9BILA